MTTMGAKLAIGAVAIVGIGAMLLFGGSSKADDEIVPIPVPPVPLPTPVTNVCPNLFTFGPPSTIAEAQGKLNSALGTSLVTDGIAGSMTRAAVAEFQAATGLVQTGCIDVATWNQLKDWPSSSGGGGGTDTSLNYIDSNSMLWVITHPVASVYRAVFSDPSAVGQAAYGGLGIVLERPTQAQVIENVENYAASHTF